MRNNETGEFELVVGNHQLLSGFFIVVLLFAVAFAMGYVVGQNSPRSAKVQAETAQQSPAAAVPADNRPQPAGPVPAAQPPAQPPPADAPATDAGAAADAAQQQPTTQPARAPQSPASATPPPAAPAAAPAPPAGSFWQVMAVTQTDADLIAKTLKDKGFPVMLSQGPNNLIRVLVGPYTDVQTMGKAKIDLENAGFLHPFRYQRDR
jgi:cell division septation protein DedD